MHISHCITTTNKALSTAHSIVFRIQDNLYVHCSAATKVHNITDTQTCHTDSALFMHSHSFCIQEEITSAILSSSDLEVIHNITSPCTSTCTTHPCSTTQPMHCFPQLSHAHKKHKAYLAKCTRCRDGVKYCGVIPI